MYKCPNCEKLFEPTVVKTVATEPFIRCPECSFSRSLNSDVWGTNSVAPSSVGIASTYLDDIKEVEVKVKAKPKSKKTAKKK
tara:strand:+ start:8138 stop:8383 length:246 start_codon:yes stop_codon:yes gene_type:complete